MCSIKLPAYRETVGSSSTGLNYPPSRTSHSASLHTRAQSMHNLDQYDHYDLPPPPQPPHRSNQASAKDRLACLEIKSKISQPDEMYRPGHDVESHPRCVEQVIARPDSDLGRNESVGTKHCPGMYRTTSTDHPPSVVYQHPITEPSEYRPTKPYMQSCGFRSQSTDQQNFEFCGSEQPGLYRTMSRATLIDQESGNVYQVQLMVL